MAITPAQAKTRAAPDEKLLKDLETRIDEKIVQAHRLGTTAESFWADELDNCFVREEIERRYTSAGWKVDYTDNQRDGKYLFFTVREPYDNR